MKEENNNNNKGQQKREPRREQKRENKREQKKLSIIPLGGLGEIGKNMTAFVYGNDMILVDAFRGCEQIRGALREKRSAKGRTNEKSTAAK